MFLVLGGNFKYRIFPTINRSLAAQTDEMHALGQIMGECGINRTYLHKDGLNPIEETV